MKAPTIPANEADRLRALEELQILDTSAEACFDGLTTLAARLLKVPIALVSLVDVDRQWFKSRYGLEASETPRDVSFCGHVVAGDASLVVADAYLDERFADNPLVTGQPLVRFYAGVPVRTPDGLVLGTLCAIDHEPRAFTPDERQLLELLARQVSDQLDLRRQRLVLQSERQRLSRFLGFFDLSLDLLCTADATLHFHELNPAWERTLGWTLEELRAHPFTHFIHPDDLRRTAEEAGRLLTDSALAIGFSNRYRHKNGHWVPLSWVAAVKDDTFFATARDMTELLNQDAELRTTASRLSSVIDTAVDAIVTITEDGTVIQANPAVERLFGYSPEKIQGLKVNLLRKASGPVPDGQSVPLFRETVAIQDAETRLEAIAVREDGREFPAEVSVSQYQIDDETFFTAIVRDTSERKRLEKMQSEFVSTVSHELRTPLTSIRGSLGLVAAGLMGELPPDARDYVNIAVSNSDRLIRLINDILDFEKMQSGRMEFRMKTVDLGAAVEAAVAANEAFAHSCGTWITIVGEPAPGDVVVDEDRLAQVLTNLMSNACKFSPRDRPVEVSVSRAGDRLRVGVRDYGAGIPEEFRSRIFQRFAQADASSSRQKGGTGLGLSICKAIVEKMRGEIGFEPDMHPGAFFFVELPRVVSIAETDHVETGRPLVLVCEDDPEVGATLQSTLGSGGFDVHLAPTLERARRLIQLHTYVLVTLDLNLPDGDGATLVGDISARHLPGDVPILVITATDRRDAQDQLGEASAAVVGIVQKPFEPARLVEIARHALAATNTGAPRVLQVEDDGDLRRVVKRLLPQSWIVEQADTVAAARERLQLEPFDLVILDLSLPDGPGEQLLDDVGDAQVIIFSASEPSPALARRVSAALVKSRVTDVELRAVSAGLLARGTRPSSKLTAQGESR